MKQYKVVITAEAKNDLQRYRDYLLYSKKSRQAAKNLVIDYRETRKQLEISADCLADPSSNKLKERGLKRINFRRHDYFLLYTIIDKVVYVTNMFHSLEDFESKLK